MRPIRTLTVLAAFLAAATATAAPRGRPKARPALELRAALRSLAESRASAAHVLRDLPTPVEPAGAYARVSRWVEDVARPGADGRPKLVVVTVPGGLGLAWARRW
ncbi:MAG TPA: hypothetical protein VGF31_01075 [Myxococcaceae bacterium]